MLLGQALPVWSWRTTGITSRLSQRCSEWARSSSVTSGGCWQASMGSTSTGSGKPF